MKGNKEKTHSETTNKIILETESATEESESKQDITPHTSPLNTQPASRMITLEAIFLSAGNCVKEWPQAVHEAVKIRLGRMPRGGWKKACNYFCEKFLVTTSEESFKNKAFLIKKKF